MNKNYIKTIVIITTTLLITFNSFSQNNNTPNFIKNDLDNYINNALKQWNIPGVAIAIVKDGKVIKSQGYGILEKGKKNKVNKNSIFMIASNTKAFVGTSLAMLEHNKQCNLNDTVTKWIPSFKMNKSHLTNTVNITDLLTHRLGLSTFQGDFMHFYSNLTKKDLYKKFPLIVPENNFRTKYGYCNVGYFWAGECISSISGISWDKYVHNNIIKPLEMNNTFVLSKNISKQKNVASAHTIQDGKITVFPHTNIDLIGPAASICSSVEDMSHWLIAQTDSGKYKDKQVIPYSVIKNTRTPRIFQNETFHSYNKTNFSLYGLGWGIQDYERTKIISHTGGILGFVTTVVIIPEHNLGIVILTNSDENWLYSALKWEIIDAYLDLPYRNYSETYHNYYKYTKNKQKNKIRILQDSVSNYKGLNMPLSKFTGKYKNKMYGNIEIVEENKQLRIKFQHHPNLSASLSYISDNRFLCTYYPERMGVHVFPFIMKNDKVIEFELKVAERLEYTSYKFIKTE